LLFTTLYNKTKDSVVSILSVFNSSQVAAAANNTTATADGGTNANTAHSSSDATSKACQLDFILDTFKIRVVNVTSFEKACARQISEIAAVFGSALNIVGMKY
jgi:hypothetical protein